MDETDALLYALLADTPKQFTVEIDIKTTMPVLGRRCFGGYRPPQKVIPVFLLPEKPVEVKYDLNMDRIHLRAAERRDTRIKKLKKV